MSSADQRHWSWGAELVSGGGADFRLWAPNQRSVSLIAVDSGQSVAMQPSENGWFSCTTDAVPVGGAYMFALANGMRVPDPATRAQRGDVHGPSILTDPTAYDWQSEVWTGRAWHEAVIYELHTGTFTNEGTFSGVAARLGHLADLGVTAIELMPVAQFAGNRGWGYDGVLPYAPHNAYGTPDDLRRLVDAAHGHGLMVLLDVVYNHFGPDGNYLHVYAQDFFDKSRQTPWGAAIDFREPAVRIFFIENALYWLDEFRLDGLRLDAIDQIIDPTDDFVLKELAREVRSRFPDRHVHLTSEDESNRTTLHERHGDDGRVQLFTAEWNDDFHHLAHVAATGENEGYYVDYDQPVPLLARSLAEGFAYQGEPSRNWNGRPRGEPSNHLPPSAFIDFLQNHDQIGNRAFGDRLTSLAPPNVIDTLTTILLLSPHIPLVFMGEEWAETRPFMFFTDFHGELADAVREGRRREFSRWSAFNDADSRARIPDPNAIETFDASKIDWTAADRDAHRSRQELFRRLLALRREHIVPRLGRTEGNAALRHAYSRSLFMVSWRLGVDAKLTLFGNLGGKTGDIPMTFWPDLKSSASFDPASIIAAMPESASAAIVAGLLPAWSVVVTVTGADGLAQGGR
ncbi:MAG: malto-oligosyltrehalose trehalohydrolase [Alphaproteobacteria bacterium]|nr:malto-oligosyltrehalose trehalohydrolase [Alphaproteobacteria bacterium]